MGGRPRIERGLAVPLHPRNIVSDPNPAPSPAVAVAIPCYNEAAAIVAVVDEWRLALPGAEIVVFDNNSTDGSGTLAAGRGARIVDVHEQGKGFVVRRIFELLGDRDAVVMIDGDGTYPADAVGPLLASVLEGRAAMAVGTRRPVDEPGAMHPVRALGNVLIGAAFAALIGRGTTDLLSGYRVFSKGYMRAVRLRSSGFEIETELAGEAAGRGLQITEEPVPYRPRIAGTQSKLRAVRDGLRILGMIVALSLRLRPWRPILLAALVAMASGVAVLILRREILGAAAGFLAAAALLAAAVSMIRREAIGARR